MLYDTAEQSLVGLDGVMVAAATTLEIVELGAQLQVSNGLVGPRFLGGGLHASLRLRVDEDLFIGATFEAAYLDQFTWIDGVRAPTVWGGIAVPFVFRFSDVIWVWVKPSIGVGLSAHLFSVGGATVPRLGTAFPAGRLTYGASFMIFEGVYAYGESSTTVPFGGGFLGLGMMVEI